jgi:FixJ family two-component response regulator
VNAQRADRDSAGPPLIAVVDDEASVHKALGRLLRAAGFDSRSFASGREFLEACRLEPPDCVVLDMHMPEMSGLEVLKQMNASGLFLPMVLITADDESARCQRVLDEGAVSWLRKPVDGPQLIRCVEQAVLLAQSVHAMNARVTAFAAR